MLLAVSGYLVPQNQWLTAQWVSIKSENPNMERSHSNAWNL